MVAKKLETKIEVHLCRYTTAGEGEDAWRLLLRDDHSHISLATVVLSDEELGLLLSGRAVYKPGTVFQDDRHGKYHECKAIQVPMPESIHRLYTARIGELNLYVREYCLEHYPDWEPDYPRSWNTHNWNYKDKTYKIILRRYVDSPPDG